MGDVYLRPLRVEDAAVSFKWRNDSGLWRYTGSRPDCIVTYDMEYAWAERVIADRSRVNFAICLKEDDRYVGNIYLIKMDGVSGELGIFIGDRSAQGKGFGWQALECLKAIAQDELRLKKIFIAVREDNAAAVATYVKCGAREFVSTREGWLSYVIDLEGQGKEHGR